MVTYEHAKVIKMTMVFIARNAGNIFKVYGETFAKFDFITITLSRLKLP